MKHWFALLALSLAMNASAADGSTRVLDDFSDANAWQASASDEVQATMAQAPGGGLCLRYDFGKVSGYAVLRRALPIELPANYAFTLRLHGSGPPNALQMKLVDASGENVWWMDRPGYVPPGQASDMLIRQRQIGFAWGPTSDKTLRRAAAIELVVASGEGGRGELCFERLALHTLPAPKPLPAPVASASASPGDAALAIDSDPTTAWRVSASGRAQWQVDFGAPRELSGLLLRWAGGAHASDFDLQFSDDGRRWRTVRAVRGSGRDVLPLMLPPDDAGNQTRYLRLVLRRGPQPVYALSDLQFMGPNEWRGRNDALRSLALASPPSLYPRGIVGEQSYWTIVGVDGGGANVALVSEDGAIEPHKGGPSIEPFVIDEDGRLSGWADVQTTHTLREGYLPLPQVAWRGAGFELDIEAGAEGSRDDARLIARYTLKNSGSVPRSLSLTLALRPWQVNPPTQFLNTVGGVSTIGALAWQQGGLQVNGRPWLQAMQAPQAVGAAAFEQGDALLLAAAGKLPPLRELKDPLGLASAVLRWPLSLAPGEAREVAIVLPLTPVGTPSSSTRAEPTSVRPEPADSPAARLDAIASHWRERLNRVSVDLPPAQHAIPDSLRSALAHILMSRDGPALQPGTRSYARSWVRDGAMMVAGLLRLGEVDAAREFTEWYAGHLFANGKVPCCVDARGADPVAENDSHGQFIDAVAQLWRHTQDRAMLERLWPKVDAAARYMEQLRQSERTPQNRQPGREAFYGLMPASISHEGYSAKPMHSYWDDFWALAGYKDAVQLATALGLADRAAELAAQRDQFQAELAASLKTAIAQHRIDYLPGAAELGDFDPSSSTMIFSPAGAETSVPRVLLDATWNRYWQESVARRDGQRQWIDYTPYELRSVSAFVRLGQPERALAMLDFFFRDQRPAGWNQWAEVVGKSPREPRFVGDMPHAWISSDYIRSALDLLAYERPSDGALVLGGGVPASWWRTGPVAVHRLGTAYGPLSFRLAPEGDDGLRLVIEPGLSVPPGGLWFARPGAAPLRLVPSADGSVDLKLDRVSRN